jgi:hypothetical protein
MADIEKIVRELGKIANNLSEIIGKRGWFSKEEKVMLEKARSMINSVLANKIKERDDWE